jgi:hypothetical protein
MLLSTKLVFKGHVIISDILTMFTLYLKMLYSIEPENTRYIVTDEL